MVSSFVKAIIGQGPCQLSINYALLAVPAHICASLIMKHKYELELQEV